MTTRVRTCIDAANAFARHEQMPAEYPEAANPCQVDDRDDEKDPEGSFLPANHENVSQVSPNGAYRTADAPRRDCAR